MSYEPLHHKYRPQTFANLVGQEAIATTLTNALRTERIAPAYLFTGPRGTGKTSSARILAKSLNCKKQAKPTEFPCGVCEVCTSIASGSALDVIEIDAASNTGVDNIRDIIERAQFAPAQCRYKVYVIDEVHMLSSAAFNALLKTLEEPPKHVVFVLATTDPQRVLPTIISRCQRFNFSRIPLEAMVKHLQHIAAKEAINITPDAITLVAQVAQGGLRDAESLLDQLSLVAGEVTIERVWDLVGAVPERDLMALTKAIASDIPQAVLDQCRRLMDRGREPLIVLQNLAGFYRDLLIAKTASSRSDLVAVTPPTWQELCDFAKQVDVSIILHGQQHLKNSEAQIKNTTQPRLWLEVTLLSLLPSARLAVKTEESSHRAVEVKTSRGDRPQISSDACSTQPQQSTQPTTPAVDLVARTENGSHSTVELKTSREDRSQTSSDRPTQPQQLAHPTTPAIDRSSHNVSPTHSPVPSTPAAVPREQLEPIPAASQSVDVEQVWQNVLTHVQPRSTQGLLRQHGRLLTFNGSVAQVGISSQPLLKLAQSKLANIEAAFQAVYKSKVTVSLETGTTASADTTPMGFNSATPNSVSVVATERPTAQSINREQTLQPVAEQLTHDQPIEGVRQVSFERVSQASPKNVAEADTRVRMQPQVAAETSNSTPKATVSQPLMPPSVQDLDGNEEEVEKALGNLKQFFEGEIIDLTDELQVSEPMAQRASEASDWIDFEDTAPFQSDEISTSDNIQADAPLDDWQEEGDQDEIPF